MQTNDTGGSVLVIDAICTILTELDPGISIELFSSPTQTIITAKSANLQSGAKIVRSYASLIRILIALSGANEHSYRLEFPQLNLDQLEAV